MKLVRNAKPIMDPNVVDVLNSVELFKFTKEQPIVFYNKLFTDTHRDWIKESKYFKIKNLNQFPNVYITNGVTDAFSDFYHINKRVSVLRGEYPYHRDIGTKVLDDISEIEPYSAFIISYPFSADGNPHRDWERIIQTCNDKHIKVFLDLCFLGVSYDLYLEIPECVTHVAFSFSKMFCTGAFRTGILYTRYQEPSPIAVQNHWNYTNHVGQSLHYKLMKSFDVDYILDKYLSQYINVCSKNQIGVTKTILFAISQDTLFDREGYANRACVTHYIQDFKNS
jgi:hypothetical protein